MTATNEELALLEKWKRRLCLQEWRIRLKTHLRPEEMTMNDAAGCTEWSESIKNARIEIIDPAYYGDHILPFSFEKQFRRSISSEETAEMSFLPFCAD